MRVKSLITLFLATSALVFLDSCSRESPLKENVGLQNNHSRVFASREPFKDPQAFIDSMANTAVNAADSIPDTLTVTINDTVHLIGILPRFVDKIYQFQWNFEKDNTGDTTIIGDNAKPQAWAYSSPGVYYPRFIAIDGNNATDTAGTGTKRLYIKVIDTKPELSVPKDTLWTSHDGDIVIPIYTKDEYGTIKNVKVDLDASGKDTVQAAKYETDGDSIFITIKNDKNYIDSLGNQTVYVIVEDDDGNETMDSVYLHFNRIPSLKIISPLDGTLHPNNQLFHFYYESEDQDNPEDLRFFIYGQISRNLQPPQRAFTSDDLIAKDVSSKIFEPRTEDGRNVITLVNNPETELSLGRIYWDMYVTDGYDVVRMERIKTDSTSSRPWYFVIYNPDNIASQFTGYAKYQGRDNHEGIRVEFNNGNSVFTGFTTPSGNYTIKVEPGIYEVRASSDIKEYSHSFSYNWGVEVGSTTRVDTLFLKDSIAPTLVTKNLDTLKTRKQTTTIYAKDLATRLESVTVKLDDEEKTVNCVATDENAVMNCNLDLEDMLDGTHILETTAKDKAGNVTSVKDTFYVAATVLTLSVNDKQNALIGDGEKLIFKAKVDNALPAAKAITWTRIIELDTLIFNTDLDESGEASVELKYDDLKDYEGKDYSMTVVYNENDVDLTTQVKFGVLSNKPSVIFTKPGDTTVVTINDMVDFEIAAYMGRISTDIKVNLDCGSDLADGVTCPTFESSTTSQTYLTTLGFKETGLHKVTAKITDNADLSDEASVYVNVIKDAPTITARSTSNTNRYKVHSIVPITIDASDKFGTVNKLTWGCGRGDLKVSLDNEALIDPPVASLVDKEINLQLPGEPSDDLRCIIKAIDDDNEADSVILNFEVLLDPPTITLGTKQDTVKINTTQALRIYGKDELGKIVKYEYACDDNEAALQSAAMINIDFDPTKSYAEAKVEMPNMASTYYCVAQVTDDDGNTAKDKVVYTVLVARPQVWASVNYDKVTIKDKLDVNAHAEDSLGGIIKKYEWGCGPRGTGNIGFTYSSETSAMTTLTMPDVAYDDYLCIVKVVDDDNNIAMDTVSLKVIQAPPTVTVTNKSLVIRPEYNITLDATASDNNGVKTDPGEIVLREWSCGTPEQINSNWKTVPEFNTVWKAPNKPNDSFICVARATDNDGNTATDTMTFTFSTETPVINVTSELTYINQGDGFSLDATKNSVWQGIDWFQWVCYDAETKKPVEEVVKFDYNKNKGTFAVNKADSLSVAGHNLYCVVSAQESSTKATFSDTAEIRIMKFYPEGVISAADTVYLWSGDEAVDDRARYFYTDEWNAKCSKRGELSDPKKSVQDFLWSFSNVDNNFYRDATHTGIIDTNSAQGNSAFIRSKTEGSMTIRLEYRDSIANPASAGFISRHHAPIVSRTVYFSRAWKNLGKDTVVAKGSTSLAPASVIINDKPVVAYLTNNKTMKAARFNGTSWDDISSYSITGTDTITALKATTDGTSLYVGLLTSKNELYVVKSTGASSTTFGLVGSKISNVTDPSLLWHSKSKMPIVTFINSKDQLLYFTSYTSGTTWQTSTKVNNESTKMSDHESVITNDGKLVLVGVDANYSLYGLVLNSLKASTKNMAKVAANANPNTMGIYADGNTLYVGYQYRGSTSTGSGTGAIFKQASIGNESLTWGTSVEPISESFKTGGTSIVARNGVVYMAIQDNVRSNLAQIHVLRYEGNKWYYHGENLLPYFKSEFYERKGYYLRGSGPVLNFDSDGKLYISMLGRAVFMYRECAVDDKGNQKDPSCNPDELVGNENNNGPIVMKYVADNWNVTPTCKE